ncbi:MAG: hypothetical protein ACUVTG_15705, partial [Candidatus Oleimicrobiaceae bacterium]
DEEAPGRRRGWAAWLVFFLFAGITLAVIFLVWKPFAHRTTPLTVRSAEELADTTATPSTEAPAGGTLAERIEGLLAGLPVSTTFRSLSYTSGRFYLELEGGTQADVQAYADGLKGMLAEGSVSVRRRGERALLVGSLESPASSAHLFGLRPSSPDSLRRLFNRTAQAAGLRVVKLSSVRRTKVEETYRTPFQLILEGKLPAVHEYLRQLDDAGAAAELTKLVVAAVGGGTVRVVLHLDLLESS